MKKILLYMIPMCMALSSCNFLDENPKSFVDRGEFFKTEAQCLSAVNSTYNGLKNVFNQQYFTHLEGTTDIICAPAAISSDDAVMNITPSNCNVSKNVWSNGYRGVRYCNYAIAGILCVIRILIFLLQEVPVTACFHQVSWFMIHHT